jgi:hypothetical protein
MKAIYFGTFILRNLESPSYLQEQANNILLLRQRNARNTRPIGQCKPEPEVKVSRYFCTWDINRVLVSVWMFYIWGLYLGEGTDVNAMLMQNDSNVPVDPSWDPQEHWSHFAST